MAFEHAADEQLRSPIIIGSALIIVGLLMWAGERFGRRELDLGHIGLGDSIAVGVAQAFRLFREFRVPAPPWRPDSSAA